MCWQGIRYGQPPVGDLRFKSPQPFSYEQRQSKQRQCKRDFFSFVYVGENCLKVGRKTLNGFAARLWCGIVPKIHSRLKLKSLSFYYLKETYLFWSSFTISLQYEDNTTIDVSGMSNVTCSQVGSLGIWIFFRILLIKCFEN